MRCDGWNYRLADQSRKNEVQEGNNIRNEVGRRTHRLTDHVRINEVRETNNTSNEMRQMELSPL